MPTAAAVRPDIIADTDQSKAIKASEGIIYPHR